MKKVLLILVLAVSFGMTAQKKQKTTKEFDLSTSFD